MTPQKSPVQIMIEWWVDGLVGLMMLWLAWQLHHRKHPSLSLRLIHRKPLILNHQTFSPTIRRTYCCCKSSTLNIKFSLKPSSARIHLESSQLSRLPPHSRQQHPTTTYSLLHLQQHRHHLLLQHGQELVIKGSTITKILMINFNIVFDRQ